MIERRVLPSGTVSWRVRWYGPDRKEVSRSFATKREATAFDADRRAALARGQFADPRAGRILLRDVWPGYLAAQPHLKERTRASYETLWRCHVMPQFGDWQVGRIGQSDVSAWISSLAESRSPSTTRHAYRVLTLILDHAVSRRLVARNEARGVRLPRLQRYESRALSVAEVESLAASMPTDQAADVVRTLAYTGLRWGELAGLRVVDVDLDRRRLTVRRAVVEINGRKVITTPKSHQARSIPLTASLLPVLRRRIEGRAPGSLVFTTNASTPLSNSNFRRATNWAKATADIGAHGLRLHDLRHTAASLMIASGATVVDAQAVLGHASSHTTLNIYAHLFQDRLDDITGRLDHLISGGCGQNPATGESE